MTLRFTKMQGAGNDFVVVRDEAGREWSKLAAAMCRRHYGVGADGLIVVRGDPAADAGMRVFNADGSEAEACGNGLRCLVRYAAEQGMVPSGAAAMRVATAAGIREAGLFYEDGGLSEIEVGMGKPQFKASEIPVIVGSSREVLDIIMNYPLTIGSEEIDLAILSMGNPHAVFFSQRPVAEYPLADIGPQVERHAIFPQRTNFEVVRVIDRETLEQRTWERGVGETLACGSGACAVAVAAQRKGFTGQSVRVKLTGGTVTVRWDGAGEVFLRGEAETVFSGEWPEEGRTA